MVRAFYLNRICQRLELFRLRDGVAVLILILLFCRASAADVAEDRASTCMDAYRNAEPVWIDPPSRATREHASIEREDIQFSVSIVPVSNLGKFSTLGQIEILLNEIGGENRLKLEAQENRPGTYHALVPKGWYVLQMNGETAFGCAPPRIIEISRKRSSVLLHLGPLSAKHYRLARSLIPFLTDPSSIGIAFNGVPPTGKTKDRALELLQFIDADTEGVSTSKEVETNKSASDQSHLSSDLFWRVKLRGLKSTDEKEKDIEKLQDGLKGEARIGLLVWGPYTQSRLLDHRFVVKLAEGIARDDIEAALREFNGRTVRKLASDGSLWLVSFAKYDLEINLKAIDVLVAQGMLQSGEPDYVASVSSDDLPTDWPNDSRYANQYVDAQGERGNHGVQKIREAWRLLGEGISDSQIPQIGSSDIYLATLDQGIRLNESEINCPASDGSSQISFCFDAATGKECDANGHELDTFPDGKRDHHGMAVFGIVGACTNNANAELGIAGDVAGVAPGIHHIVVKKPNPVGSVRYLDTLLWLAGIELSCPDVPDPEELGDHPCGWPKLPHPADIINCSHGEDDLGQQLPTYADYTLDRLVNDGRSGRGVVIVYSAGNNSQPIEDVRPMAADPRTLAIASCGTRPNGLLERLQCSNFGNAVDICALGDSVPTIDVACEDVPPPKIPCNFQCTSAAAPQVSGTVALVLSVSKNLQWNEVRDVLRESADRDVLDSSAPGCNWQGDRSYCYGSGRLNTCQAIANALERKGVALPSNPCP